MVMASVSSKWRIRMDCKEWQLTAAEHSALISPSREPPVHAIDEAWGGTTGFFLRD